MPFRIPCGRLLSIVVGLVAVTSLTPAVAGAQTTFANWDLAQQRQVVRAGLMSDVSSNNFGGAQPLRDGQADQAMAALANLINGNYSSWGQPRAVVAARAPEKVVTVAGFDALVVNQLGLAASPRTSSTLRRKWACARPRTTAPRWWPAF